MPSKGEKVRWAVIGATGIADRRAIPEGIIPAENSELVGVMATNAERVRKVAEKYGGVPWFTDARQMLEQVEADACYLACPPAVRLEYVQLCAEAGVHVFAEKPLARTVGEAEEMLEVCRQHGVKMGTAFMLPFHHLAQEATRLGAGNGGLGPGAGCLRLPTRAGGLPAGEGSVGRGRLHGCRQPRHGPAGADPGQ